ncbi:MAG: type II secretion system protein GspC [Pseudomonadota bacterium]
MNIEQVKKYLWILNLIFIAGIALFLASLFAKVGVSRLLEPDAGNKSKQVAGLEVVEEEENIPFKDDYLGIVDRNIFDSENTLARKNEPTLEESNIPIIPPKPVLDLTSAPVKSDISSTLIGTLIRNDSKKSTAAIKTAGKTQILKIGDSFADAEKITDIQRGKVIFIRNYHLEFLQVDKDANKKESLGTSPSYASKYSSPYTSSYKSKWSEGISKENDDHFVIEKGKFDESMKNINEILYDAASMPVKEGGKVIGFQILAIEPNSVYEHLGIEDGDIILKVNGKSMDNVEKALSFFQTLQGQTKFNIDVKKDGQTKHYTYEVK